MSFATGAPGCCCCKNYYNGGSLSSVNMVLLASPLDGGRYPEYPSSTFTAVRWTLDHYHERLFFIQWFTAGTTRKIGYCPMKLLEDRSQITITEVHEFSSSFQPIKITTISEESKVLYVLADATVTDQYYFYEVGFDGTGDGQVFAKTMASASNNLLRRVEHCRYNDKIYYVAQLSGDTYFKVYRCDRDGANNTLIYSVGGTNPTLNFFTGIAFDNVRGKLYVTQRYTTDPYSSDILRMDLDGTNVETVHSTDGYSAPYTSYGIYAIRFSHKDDSLYWIEGSSAVEASDNSTDPDSGMYKAGFDGSNPTKLYGRYEINLTGTTIGSVNEIDIGCGFETLGAATEA